MKLQIEEKTCLALLNATGETPAKLAGELYTQLKNEIVPQVTDECEFFKVNKEQETPEVVEAKAEEPESNPETNEPN